MVMECFKTTISEYIPNKYRYTVMISRMGV